MYQEQIKDYYNRPEIQKAILEVCENREVVPVLANGGFGSRPDAVYYEKDIDQMFKNGAVELHGSVERWRNPLSLKSDMRKEEQDDLRIGWDLIIDIDCHKTLKEAKIAALTVIEALELYKISNYGVKFSGNRGFHISVPFEAFPPKIMALGKIETQYPKVPKAMINYLTDFIHKDLKERLGQEPKEVLSLDAAVIASRHLFRLPYCLHRKTWLVSVPLKKEEIHDFDPEQAKADNVKAETKFLKFEKAEQTEGLDLMRAALFWDSKKVVEKKVDYEHIPLPATAITPEYFPPCIKNISAGLEDGKKRSIFALITYLHHIGWKRPEITQYLTSWNQKNKPPLADNILKIALNNQYGKEKVQMSPNCDNFAYYVDYGVCKPDDFCKKINNPVTYTLNKVKGARKARRKPRRRKRINKPSVNENEVK